MKKRKGSSLAGKFPSEAARKAANKEAVEKAIELMSLNKLGREIPNSKVLAIAELLRKWKRNLDAKEKAILRTSFLRKHKVDKESRSIINGLLDLQTTVLLLNVL